MSHAFYNRPYLEFRLWYATTVKGNVSWDPPCRFFPQRENLLLAPTVAEALNWDEKKKKNNLESQQRGYWGRTWERCKEKGNQKSRRSCRWSRMKLRLETERQLEGKGEKNGKMLLLNCCQFFSYCYPSDRASFVFSSFLPPRFCYFLPFWFFLYVACIAVPLSPRFLPSVFFHFKQSTALLMILFLQQQLLLTHAATCWVEQL